MTANEHWSTDYSDPDQKKYFQVKENHLKMQTMIVEQVK
jgi:hypothetical protein